MKENIERIIKEFKESEKLLARPISEYKSVKGRYNKETLEEVKKESTAAIKKIRDEAVTKALYELAEVEKETIKAPEEKELTQQDLTTLIYLLENTDEEKELESLYRENKTNNNFKKIFKVIENKKDLKGLSEKIDIESKPKELEDIERARSLIQAFKLDDMAYPMIDAENILNEKQLGTLEYKNIDELLG